MNSHHLKKRLTLSLILVFVLTTFTGRGGFNAKSYTKACLDLLCSGETKKYASVTGLSEEAATDTYNTFINQEMDSLKTIGVSDDKADDFRTLFIDIYKKADYKVGKATKNDDGSFTVPVTIRQFKIFNTATQNAQQKLNDKAIEQEKAEEKLSDEELSALFIDYWYDELKAGLEDGEYADKTEIKVDVTSTDGKYSLSTEQLQKIFNELFDADTQTAE